MGKIKYLVLDVDGTMTNGKIYMGQSGEEFKSFDIKDGCGLLLVLPELDIKPIIITARKSSIVENRCKELKIEELHQGVSNKLKELTSIVGEDLGSVAYAGDDLPDIPCMVEIKKAGGLVLCPADAIPEVKELADYISPLRAGDGAIRDCINYLGLIQKNTSLQDRIRIVIDWILSGRYKTEELNAAGITYSIQEYETKKEEDCILESHRNHVDVQFMIEGKEEFKTYLSRGLISGSKYNQEKDIEYWKDGIVASHSILVPGSIIIIYNNQAHKGAIQCFNKNTIKKLVVKILV